MLPLPKKCIEGQDLYSLISIRIKYLFWHAKWELFKLKYIFYLIFFNENLLYLGKYFINSSTLQKDFLTKNYKKS